MRNAAPNWFNQVSVDESFNKMSENRSLSQGYFHNIRSETIPNTTSYFSLIFSCYMFPSFSTTYTPFINPVPLIPYMRSEERRVGKEGLRLCRAGGSADQ